MAEEWLDAEAQSVELIVAEGRPVARVLADATNDLGAFEDE
jgi:hypothetical protein